MDAHALFMLTAIGNAILFACCSVRLVFAVMDWSPWRALGWAIFGIGYAALAVAFFLRAMGGHQ